MGLDRVRLGVGAGIMAGLRDVLQRQRSLLTHRLATLPILVLMPHEGCNCRCAMCDLWRPSQPGRDLSLATVGRSLETLRRLRVQRVVLSGGEALLCPHLWEMCRMLRALPARITLLTNGMLLAKRAQGVARWCDEVIVSLDGTEETHDSLRGVKGATERLASGTAALRAIDPALRITGRCVVQRQNFRELPLIVAEARRIGLDRISFLAADVSSAAFNRLAPSREDRAGRVALGPTEVKQFRAVLQETVRSCARDFAEGFIAESPAKLGRMVRYYAALNGGDEFPPVRCNAPWVSAVVEADGSVRPCFFHPPLGNLNALPLDSILNSPEAVAFRRTLDTGSDPTCRRCVCSLHLGLRSRA